MSERMAMIAIGARVIYTGERSPDYPDAAYRGTVVAVDDGMATVRWDECAEWDGEECALPVGDLVDDRAGGRTMSERSEAMYVNVTEVGKTLPAPGLKWIGQHVRLTGKRPLYAPWDPGPYTYVYLCISTTDPDEPHKWVRCWGWR